MMTNKHISTNNDVKGARTSRKGSSSGNGQRQADRGRHPAKSCLVSLHKRGCDGLSPSTSRSGTATVASAKITKKLECVSRKMKKKIKEEKNVHIRIATINVRTCQEDIKLAKIVQAASSLDIDILAIQEARRLGSDCKMLLSESIYGWQIAWSGHRRKREHGVATLFAPHVKVEDFKEHLAARIISTTVEVKGMRLSILNAYAPTDLPKTVFLGVSSVCKASLL